MDIKTCEQCGKHTENYIENKIYVDYCRGSHIMVLCLNCYKQRNAIFKQNKENDI